MTDKDRNGISLAILHEFLENDLPVMQRAMSELKAGKTLSEGEVEVLLQQLELVRDWYAVSWEIPKYKELLAKAIESYEEIARLALLNEEQNPPGDAAEN